MDPNKQALSDRIHQLVMTFMRDTKNVMLCVEQASDAATMSTLSKCKELDPSFKRTVLIRNKLDKYYSDLTGENVDRWVNGFGDLPENLVRFALTLPWWQDGEPPPASFEMLREQMNSKDIQMLSEKGLSPKLLQTIGFRNFATYMEKRIELFVEAIGPVMHNLSELKDKHEKKERSLQTEFDETDPHRILGTTRECGTSFANALTYVMHGSALTKEGRMSVDQELREFHDYHQKLGSDHFVMLPTEDFCGLSDYINYLTEEACIPAGDVEVNGGAQFRRVMAEVEIFLRFSEIAVETKKQDVIQARGVSMSSLTWRDVVVKLLCCEAHLPLQRRVRYVGERIKWFFMRQKEVVLDFMSNLEGEPSAKMYSANYVKHVKLIKQNEMIKHLVFQTYDDACDRQLNSFCDLFQNMLTSTFSNPWVFLKGGTVNCGLDGEMPPAMTSDEDTKERIPLEIQSRSGIENTLSKWLQDIPTDSHQIDEAVDKVQMLVLKTYSFIRSQVCDQVELFAHSFFKLPMLRRLEEDMAQIKLSEADRANYKARRDRLEGEIKKTQSSLVEIDGCIDRLQNFKLKCEALNL